MIESNKKKYNIGILTMHYVPNYGAILQAYATVTFFRRASETFFNGAFDIEIVD